MFSADKEKAVEPENLAQFTIKQETLVIATYTYRLNSLSEEKKKHSTLAFRKGQIEG